MDLLLGQLVYTSFPEIGFKSLASGQVPTQIQQAFTQRVVSQYWNSYNPPRSGYRAVYLHQVTPERSLFGWLYNDGADDMRRTHVPYFICYYLASPLYAFQLENIFTCLHNGPVALIDRHSLPATLETMVLPDLWSYQGAKPGVAIPSGVRKRSQIAQKQGKLLDLFVPVDEQQMVIELNGQTYEQQTVNLSIYTRYIIEGIETIKSKDVTPVKALNKAVVVNEPDTPSRDFLPQISTVQINIDLEKSTAHNFFVAYRTSQLLLKISIAATVLALLGSIYGLVQTSIPVPRHPEVISSPISRVFYKTLASVPNSILSFSTD